MLIADDITALERWGEPRLAWRLGEPVSPPVDWSPTIDEVTDEETLREAGLEASENRPIHVLVDRREHRIRSPRVVSHVWSGAFPDGALYQLTPRVMIASPSFCLQQMSARRGIVKATVTAMEICGEYTRSSRAKDGLYRRPPLATPEELRDHFSNTHGYGAKRARAALRHVIAGSRSPMETVVVLLFTLPMKMGGCGLPPPRLNMRVEIPSDLQNAIGKPYVVVDLCWLDQRIILEYDSYEWHTLPRAVDSDNTRNEGLRDEEWMVRSVTAGMLADDAMRRHLVSKVVGRFGRKLPEGEEFDLLQHNLVQELLRA